MDHRRGVGVSQLALLVSASEEQVRKVLHSEGIMPAMDSIPWGEAAGYLFDAWPRAQIIAALPPDAASLIPVAFHPSPAGWGLPPFILRAIAHQAALQRKSDPRFNPAAAGRFASPSVEDYIADILYNEIQPDTVAALGCDPAFLQAYHYPPVD